VEPPRDWLLYWMAMAAIGAVDGPLVKLVAHHALCHGLIDETLIDLDGSNLSGEERVAEFKRWLQSFVPEPIDRNFVAYLAGSRDARAGLKEGKRKSQIAFGMSPLVGYWWDEDCPLELRRLRSIGEEAYDYESGYAPREYFTREEAAFAKKCIEEVNKQIDVLASWHSGLPDHEQDLIIRAGEFKNHATRCGKLEYWFNPWSPPDSIRGVTTDPESQ
jgi:hypothetical protein